jgi:hypothetical protein
VRAADSKRATRFGLELLRRGLYVVPNAKLYISLAHTDAHIDLALDVDRRGSAGGPLRDPGPL